MAFAMIEHILKQVRGETGHRQIKAEHSYGEYWLKSNGDCDKSLGHWNGGRIVDSLFDALQYHSWNNDSTPVEELAYLGRW